MNSDKLNKLLKTKIDELPQLLLVFTGKMRLWGPRPKGRKDFTYKGVFDQKKFDEYKEDVLDSFVPGLFTWLSLGMMGADFIGDLPSMKNIHMLVILSLYRTKNLTKAQELDLKIVKRDRWLNGKRRKSR